MGKAPALAILIAFLGRVAFCQPTASVPEFEVASIRQATPQADGRVSTRMSTDPARLNYSNVSLSDVIEQAYRVQPSQISGPAWLGTERFDIVAKIPANVKTEQLPQMLQALLVNRFKLKLHSEEKEMPVYALVAGKSGPRLQKAESATGLTGEFGRGRDHLSGKVSMPQFASYLSVQLSRPVLDETKLDGTYAIALDWLPDSAESPVPAPSSQPGTSGPSIFTALEEQLGLRLAARKAPTEILVVDQVEKTPTEN